MGIIFTTGLGEVVGFVVKDCAGHCEEFTTADAAQARMEVVCAGLTVLTGAELTGDESADFDLHLAYMEVIEADPVPDVDMTNDNAATVCEVLGVAVRDGEEGIDPQDFLGRILMAQALAPEDAGVPWHAPTSTARWEDCGRRRGYLQDRLLALQTLAEWAIVRGYEAIYWN